MTHNNNNNNNIIIIIIIIITRHIVYLLPYITFVLDEKYNLKRAPTLL